MSLFKVQAALVQAFQNGTFNLPTVWENNQDYEPQTDTAWCEFRFIPNEPEPRTLGDQGEDEFTGVVNVILNYPLNSGIGETMEKADEIKAVFKPGSTFEDSGQTVRVTRSGLARGGETEAGFYQSVFTISWRALAPR